MGVPKVAYFSTVEAAKKLHCSQATVRRVAKRHRVGIQVSGNRLVALTASDIAMLKPLIQPTSGNPDWIARGQRRQTV